ncbi:WD40-repeat-containing domain protein [Gaertneriomyces semiglobifer]|nr:WD40-repeat-containing domain protein [Gaertneriomyces semiglobifer]
MLELEKTIAQLKDERADLYKSQSINSMKMLELLEGTRLNEAKVEEVADENKTLKASLTQLQLKFADVQELIKEKDHVIQILKDELATHQLELHQREAELKKAQESNRSLEHENKQLIDRWILLKQDEARRVNEANEFVETTLRTKAEASRATSPLSSRRTSEVAYLDTRQPLIAMPTRVMRKVDTPDKELNALAISLDSSIIATGSNDRKVVLYDTKAGNVKMTLSGVTQGVMAVAFNYAGDLVLGSSNDCSVKIWQVGTGRSKHTLTGHIGKVYSARFTDEDRVISGSHDRTIKLWDLNKGFCTKTIFTLSSCNDVCPLSGDGTLIASAHLDTNIRIFDTRSGQVIRELTGVHGGQVTSVEVTPGRDVLVSCGRDSKIGVVDMRMWGILRTLSHETFAVAPPHTRLTISPDGAYTACGGLDGNLYIWNILTGKCERVVSGAHSTGICGAVWAPNGREIWTAERGGGLVAWG